MSQSKTTIVKVWQKIIQVHSFAIHELKKVAWLHHKRHTPKSDAIGQFFLFFPAKKAVDERRWDAGGGVRATKKLGRKTSTEHRGVIYQTNQKRALYNIWY